MIKNKIVKSSFFWKFSRDGDFSSTYISFIIDVPNSQFKKQGQKIIWTTHFQTLCKILLLLQDVELMNSQMRKGKNATLLNPSYIKMLNYCGYNPKDKYQANREKESLVCGEAVVGKHIGIPLHWGYFEENSNKEIIELDVSNFIPIRDVPGNTGVTSQSAGRDLLSCYRKHNSFTISNYWDFMPMHKHIPIIFHSLKSCNQKKATQFVEDVLLWEKI